MLGLLSLLQDFAKMIRFDSCCHDVQPVLATSHDVRIGGHFLMSGEFVANKFLIYVDDICWESVWENIKVAASSINPRFHTTDAAWNLELTRTIPYREKCLLGGRRCLCIVCVNPRS